MKNMSMFDLAKRQAGVGFFGPGSLGLTGAFLFWSKAPTLILTFNEGGKIFNWTIVLGDANPYLYGRFLEKRILIPLRAGVAA